MRDLKKLLNKKGWTGRELGIIEVANAALTFKKAVEGDPNPDPIISPERFQKMINNNITTREQGNIYNGYISIHEWIQIKYHIANTQMQQAQFRFTTLFDYLIQANLAEDIFSYVEKLPEIMTEKQYEDTKAQGIENCLTDEDGKDIYSNLFNLIEKATHYYLHQLQTNPKKANPLKAIRKKYIADPIKSKIILSRWNKVFEKGYYTLQDGRRSDQMTIEEWRAAVTSPEIKKALEDMESPDIWGAEAQAVIEKRITERAKVIFNGGTEEEADRLQEQRENTPRVEWHTYEEPPEDITKWDIIEQELLTELYLADLDGSGDEYSHENFNAFMKDFATEFKELIKVILADMNKRYFKGSEVSEDLLYSGETQFLISWRELYNIDFYGEKATVEDDIQIFSGHKLGDIGNKRALFNGIAILRPCNFTFQSHCIDERGYYVEPPIENNLSNFTLEAFFPEAEDYAENIEQLEIAEGCIMWSYYYLMGWNKSLDMVQSYFEIPEIEIFKYDIGILEQQIDNYNAVVPILYKKIQDTEYRDRKLKEKKLQVLKEVFPILDYKKLAIPKENIEEARGLFEGFRAFREERNRFDVLMSYPPEYEDG